MSGHASPMGVERVRPETARESDSRKRDSSSRTSSRRHHYSSRDYSPSASSSRRSVRKSSESLTTPKRPKTSGDSPSSSSHRRSRISRRRRSRSSERPSDDKPSSKDSFRASRDREKSSREGGRDKRSPTGDEASESNEGWRRSRSPSRRRKTRDKDRYATRRDRKEWLFDSPPRELKGDQTTGGAYANFLRRTDDALPPSDGTPTADRPETFGSHSELAKIAEQLGLNAEGAKAARELYIGNLPPNGVDVNQLVEFLNAAMVAMELNVMPGNPVVKSWISTDGHFAFVEFRTMEEASLGMQLNGLNCLGYSLRIGRPKTYPAELAALTAKLEEAARQKVLMRSAGLPLIDGGLLQSQLASTLGVPMLNGALPTPEEAAAAAQKAAASLGIGGAASAFLDPSLNAQRLVMLDIPYTLTEDRCRELITAFGTLRSFSYTRRTKKCDDGKEGEVGEAEFRNCDAICCFEFDDSRPVKLVFEELHGRHVANSKLQILEVTDAVARGKLAEWLESDETAVVLGAGGELMRVQVPTRVVMLSNLVTPDELMDDKEYHDIVEDVTVECSSFGKVIAIEIPRPIRGFAPGEIEQSEVGFAFVKFSTAEGAGKARKNLGGRRFAGRTVDANYFSERRFADLDFAHPKANYAQEDSCLYAADLIEIAKAEFELPALAAPPPEDPSADADDALALALSGGGMSSVFEVPAELGGASFPSPPPPPPPPMDGFVGMPPAAAVDGGAAVGALLPSDNAGGANGALAPPQHPPPPPPPHGRDDDEDDDTTMMCDEDS